MNGKKVKITLVGVGTPGCKVRDKISASKLSDDIKTVALNGYTDELEACNANVKIQVPGIAGHPFRHCDVRAARDGAIEIYDQIVEALKQ